MGYKLSGGRYGSSEGGKLVTPRRIQKNRESPSWIRIKEGREAGLDGKKGICVVFC